MSFADWKFRSKLLHSLMNQKGISRDELLDATSAAFKAGIREGEKREKAKNILTKRKR